MFSDAALAAGRWPLAAGRWPKPEARSPKPEARKGGALDAS